MKGQWDMIQDIYPHVYHNEYKDFQPETNDFILVFHKNIAIYHLKGQKEEPKFS